LNDTPAPPAAAPPPAASRTPPPYRVAVEFGDCDPAGIVYYPNFLRWIDAASRHFFVQCGVPRWQETERTHGIIGTPLVDVQTRFLRPATYGDLLEIDTVVSEWRQKSFVMRHSVRRGNELLVDATEVRVFARRVDGDRHRIQAVPVPPDFRALCGG
jgi:4-hydroxybenzoyl-CoA thioesterase